MSHTYKPRNETETDLSIQSPQINHKLVVSCTNLRVGAHYKEDHFKLRGRLYMSLRCRCVCTVFTLFPSLAPRHGSCWLQRRCWRCPR